MKQVFFAALTLLIIGCNEVQPPEPVQTEPVDTTQMIANQIDSVYQTVQDFVIARTKLDSRGRILNQLEAQFAKRDTNYYSTLSPDFNGIWGLAMSDKESMLFVTNEDRVAVEAKYDPVRDQLFAVNSGNKIEFFPKRKDLSVFQATVLDTSYVFAEVPSAGTQRVFFSLNGNKTLIKR